MKIQSPRIRYCFFCLPLLVFGCSKPYAPELTPNERTVFYLTGSNGIYSTWQLTAMMINQVPVTMTPTIAAFHKTYNTDGSFSDSDGMQGTWLLVHGDSLSEHVTNAPPTAYALQGYKISAVSDTSLTLLYRAGNQDYCVRYRSVQ